MVKKSIKILLLLSIYLFLCKIIYQNSHINTTKISIDTYQEEISPKKEIPIGTLIIEKIKIKESLFAISSTKNNIEEHITILNDSIEPDHENSIMILAAHSGLGKIAYFNDLNKLQKEDEIKLIYKNNLYIYQITDLWEQNKNGYITISKEKNKQLILTTCSPTNSKKQLIISSILTKEESI